MMRGIWRAICYSPIPHDMAYVWDSYTRNLVRGWSKLGMTAAQIHDAWPWPIKPGVHEILRIQLELSRVED